MLLDLTIPLTPVPASRPRVTKWGTYYSKSYKQWLLNADRVVPDHVGTPIDRPVRAIVLFAIPRSRTGKLVVPVGDGDNYEKAVYDVIQKKGYLTDDKWIIHGEWTKIFLPYGSDGFTKIQLCEAEPQAYTGAEGGEDTV